MMFYYLLSLSKENFPIPLKRAAAGRVAVVTWGAPARLVGQQLPSFPLLGPHSVRRPICPRFHMGYMHNCYDIVHTMVLKQMFSSKALRDDFG